VCFFYIETRGPTLEEVAKIFDGDQEELPNEDVDPFDEFARNEHLGVEKQRVRSVRYEHIKLDDMRR
jgi:hypothetical protein